MSGGSNPFDLDGQTVLRAIKGAILVLILWLTALTVLQASAGIVLSFWPGFLVLYLVIVLLAAFVPLEPFSNEPEEMLKRLRRWDRDSVVGVLVSGFVFPWILLLLRSYGLLPRVEALLLSAIPLAVSLVFPCRNAEIIIRSSMQPGSLHKSTISLLLKRNVALSMMTAVCATWVAFDLGLYYVVAFGVPVYTMLQALGLVLLLASSPIFLLLIAFVEVPGLVGLAKNKSARRQQAESVLADLASRPRLTEKQKLLVLTAGNQLVQIELESDHPFPLISKILGGGFLVLIITVVLSLLV